MKKFQLPYVNLPVEFISLLKSNMAATSSSSSVFDVIRPNKALFSILEKAFKEFDDGRGLEKVMTALGWPNFRERMSSVYVYKSVYGDFPAKTDMDLVEDIKEIESRFAEHSVHGISRLFLLGFYLKLANIELQHREDNQFLDIKIPSEVNSLLKLSQGRSERIDWLILILTHLHLGLGEKTLANGIISGKKFEDLYQLMTTEAQENMSRNLLAYGSSIQEADVFLYEKV